jgi:hypothetical protein
MSEFDERKKSYSSFAISYQKYDVEDVEEVGEEVDGAEVRVSRLGGRRGGHATLSRHLCNKQ